MPSTLAFAPRAEDLEEDFFEAPIMAFTTTPPGPATRSAARPPEPEAIPIASRKPAAHRPD